MAIQEKLVITVRNVHWFECPWFLGERMPYCVFASTGITVENKILTSSHVFSKFDIFCLYKYVIPVSHIPAEVALELNATCVPL